jgi:hypothetical protein
MSQKVKDFILLVRKERKYQVLVLIIGLCLGFLLLADNQPRRGRRPSVRANANDPIKNPLASEEAYRDLMVGVGAKVDSLEQSMSAVRNTMEDITRRQDTFEKTTTEVFRKMIEKIQEQQAMGGNAVPAEGPIDSAPYEVEGITPEGEVTPVSQTEPEKMESFTAPPPPPQVGPPPKALKKLAVVGAGDSARIRLLSGVAAPTDGTPYPVVFKMVSSVFGPDDSMLPLGEARIVAAAQGSLTDQRVLFRLTSLNVRLPNGRRKVMEVDGWVVGEDGVRGMSGILIDPFGKIIGAAGMAGMISGFGEAVSANNVTRDEDVYGGDSIEVSGSETEYAAGQGIKGAANSYSRLIERRVGEFVPHVVVYSGREATAVFAKSFTIEQLFDVMEDDAGADTALD